MAGGLKLFDYRMTEKEHILAETIFKKSNFKTLDLLVMKAFAFYSIRESML